MKLAACYARYSSHAQDGGTSIEVQLDSCHQAAGGPCQDYIDEAKSGTAIGGRDALQQLLADAKAGKISRVLLYKFDRLGRNLFDAANVIGQLENCGVELVSVTEGKDRLTRGVLLAIAEHFTSALRKSTRDGLAKRHEQRAWTGGPPPMGYQLVQGDNKLNRLQVNDEEAAVVRIIFDSYLGGHGMKQIAGELQAAGFRPRRARHWMHTSIRAVLVNHVYRGRVYYGLRMAKPRSQQSGKRTFVRTDITEAKYYQDEALRIVTEEQFFAVQAKLASHVSSDGMPRGGGLKRPFTGLVKCGNCNSTAYSQKSQNSKGLYYYLGCGYRARTNGGCDNTTTLREDVLLRDIQRVIGMLLEGMDGVVEEALVAARKKTTESREEVKRIRESLSTLDRRAEGMTRLLVDPDMPEAAKRPVKRQLGELEVERDKMVQKLDDITRLAQNATENLADDVQAAFNEIRQGLSGSSPEFLRHVIQKYIGPLRLLSGEEQEKRGASTNKFIEAHRTSMVAGAGFEPATFGL